MTVYLVWDTDPEAINMTILRVYLDRELADKYLSRIKKRDPYKYQYTIVQPVSVTK